jgi:pyridoxamine 5'-phosphate oxidase-like protein
MAILNLPPHVVSVFRAFRTCEFTTLAKDGTPVTWPTLPFFQPTTGRFLITTSIGLPDKVSNIRRNPRVSLLFSDPTASGLPNSPAVLVQGDAEAPDEVVTSFTGLEEQLRLAFERQPASTLYSSNVAMRYLFDWYYMRLLIHVSPRRILWWEHADFTQVPYELEVQYVE